MAVFGAVFAQWVRDGEERSFAVIAADVLRELLDPAGRAPVLRAAP